MSESNKMHDRCKRCHQNILRLFLLQMNRAWQGHARILGANSNVFESVCFVVSCCLQWHVCYTHFCDYMHVLICDFTLELRLEQRADIKFSVKLGKSAMETPEMLQQSFGSEAMNWTRCSEWCSCFKRDRMSLEDN